MARDHRTPALRGLERLEAAALHLRRNELEVLELATRGRLSNAAIAERHPHALTGASGAPRRGRPPRPAPGERRAPARFTRGGTPGGRPARAASRDARQHGPGPGGLRAARGGSQAPSRAAGRLAR